MKYPLPQLSIVIPLYNEELAIAALFTRLNKLKKKLPTTEVILVNDGSQDRTAEKVEELALQYEKKLLDFSRNFGHQAALLAGMEVARGKYVVTMDGDLQHPPEVIPLMLSHHKKGAEIVLTKRIDTDSVPFLKQLTARVFYFLMNSISQTRIGENISDFRSMDRQTLNALLAMKEKRKFLRGMVQWIGFRTIILPFTVQKRVAGTSKYSLQKMMRLAFDGVTSFSTVPLYFSGLFSVVLFLAAFFYGLYVIVIRIESGSVVSGWASMLLVTLTIGGFLSLFLGLIGVYLAAIYDELKGRPTYILRTKSRKKS